MSKHVEAAVIRRRDATALLQTPAADSPYLVRLGPKRWIVRGGSPGCNHESLLKAFATIVEFLRGRPEARTEIRIGCRSVRRRIRHTLSPSAALP
jgi:hypothetical protein